MKKLFLQLCILIFILVSCSQQYIVNDIDLIQQSIINSKIKIALIGFFPYEYKLISTTYHSNLVRTTYIGHIDYNNSFKSKLGFGIPIEKIIFNGINTKVKDRNIEIFMSSYLSQVGAAGSIEFRNMFQKNNNKFQLKNSNTDYFLIGIHKPTFRKKDKRMQFTEFLTIITLGLFPSISYEKAESRFLLFDKNLQFVKQLDYTDEYIVKKGLLVKHYPKSNIVDSKTPDSIVWQPHIKKAKNQIIEFINSIK